MIHVQTVTKKYNDIQGEVDFSTRRLDEHEFLLKKFGNRLNQDAEYNERFTQLEKKYDEKMSEFENVVSSCETKANTSQDRTEICVIQSKNLEIDLQRHFLTLKEEIESFEKNNVKQFEAFEHHVTM